MIAMIDERALRRRHEEETKREPEVLSALGEIAHAVSAVDERLDLLFDRLAQVRSQRPRPAGDPEGGADELASAPLAAEMRGQARRLQRLEGRIAGLLGELEV